MKILITLFAISAASVNSLVIFIIVRHRNLREDVTARLMVSSAASDLGCSLILIGMIAAIAWLNLDALPLWLAALQAVSIKMFGQSSSLHLCFIAIAKCIVICRPFTHREILSDLKFGLGLALLWAASILYGLTTIENGTFSFVWRLVDFNFDPETYLILSRSSSDQSIRYFIQFLLTLLSIVVSYGIIFKTILKHRRQISALSQPQDNTENSTANMAREFLRSARGARNMFIITFVYLIAFAPAIISIGIKASVKTGQQCMWIILLHTMTSSLLYMILHKEVREAVKKEFRMVYHRMFGENHKDTTPKAGTSTGYVFPRY